MRIEVSDFYQNQGFTRAYLFLNNEGRRCVGLEKPQMRRGRNIPKRFISYAKYLWESAHQTFVPKGYEVDHIDGDKSNDVLSNLQLLNQKENKIKACIQTGRYGITMCDLTCPVCGKPFTRELRFLRRVERQPACCSKRCSTTLQAKKIQFDKMDYVAYCEIISYKHVNEEKEDK